MDSRRTSEFPGFANLWNLRAGGARGFRGRLPLDFNGTSLLFDGPPAGVVPRLDWKAGAARPQDVFPSSQMGAFFVHERVLRILEREEISGWEAFSIEVLDKAGEHHRGFSGLRIRGRCGPIQDWQSVPVTHLFPGGPSTVWVGLYFDEASWDGSDIFIPDGSTFIVVTDRVRCALEAERLRHLEFKRMTEVQQILLEPPTPPTD